MYICVYIYIYIRESKEYVEFNVIIFEQSTGALWNITPTDKWLYFYLIIERYIIHVRLSGFIIRTG
jgi:hypothetical protein